MNILMTVANDGMNDTRVRKQAEVLARNGHEVTVLGFQKEPTENTIIKNGVIYRINKYEAGHKNRNLGLISIFSNKRFLLSPIGFLITLLTCFRFLINNFGFIFKWLIIFILLMFSIIIFVKYQLTFFNLFAFFDNDLLNASFVIMCSIILNAVIFLVLFVLLFVKKTKASLINTIKGVWRNYLKPNSLQYSIGLSTKFLAGYPIITNHFLRNLNKELKVKHYDIIHAHDLNTLGAASRVAAKYKIKLIFDAHEMATYEDGWSNVMKVMFKRAWMKAVIKKVDGVITVSEYFTTHFTKTYGTKNTCVIYNSPDAEQINDTQGTIPNTERPASVREELQLKHDDVLIVYIGGINARRGAYELGEALGIVSSNIHVAFITNTKENILCAIKKRAETDKSGVQLHFLPAVPQQSLITYVSTADASIITRLPPTNYYNIQRECALPNKLFESMFARLPLILGECTANRDLLKKYPIGVMAKNAFPHEFAQAIEEMSENKQKYAYSHETIEGITNEFSWKECEKRLIAFYDELESTK